MTLDPLLGRTGLTTRSIFRGRKTCSLYALNDEADAFVLGFLF